MSEIQSIFDSLRKIVRALRLNSHEIQKQCGLSGTQLFVLQKIGMGEALSINDIAARTSTDQSSVSVVVAKLVAKGLLIKKMSDQDKRLSLHSLSAAGKKAAVSTQGLVQHELLRALVAMPTEERTLLAELLVRLVQGAELSTHSASLFFEDEGIHDQGKTRARNRPGKRSHPPSP